MKRNLLLAMLLALPLWGLAGNPPADAPVITLKAKPGSLVILEMGAADGTPVWVETDPGSFQSLTIGIFPSKDGYKTQKGILKVHGAVATFNCSRNITSLDVSRNTALTGLSCYWTQITSLDVSHNTALTFLGCQNNRLTSLDVSRNTNLKTLECYGNPFLGDVDAVNALYCKLPESIKKDGVIKPAQNPDDPNLAAIKQSSGKIAMSKGWTVQFCDDNTPITTEGTFTNCGEKIHLDRTSLALTVGKQTKLKATVSPAGSTVEWDSSDRAVVSVADGIVTALKSGTAKVFATIHGTDDVTFCTVTVMTGLPVDTPVITLTAEPGRTVSLGITAASNDTPVWVETDPGIFQVLTVGTVMTSQSYTPQNGILKVHGAVTGFWCPKNHLTSLDVSRNTKLKILNCYGNQLTSLDVSRNTALTELYCCKNPFLGDVEVVNALYCSLLDRTGERGIIQPAYDDHDPHIEAIRQSSGTLATSKGWDVQFYEGHRSIPTEGNLMDCADVPKIQLDPTSLTLEVGKQAKLKATVSPAGSTVAWGSSDGTVVSVADGMVTAHKAGMATVFATIPEKNLSASCAVMVREPAPSNHEGTPGTGNSSSTTSSNTPESTKPTPVLTRERELMVSPMPFGDHLRVEGDGIASLRLYTLQAYEVLREEPTDGVLDTSTIGPGAYILVVTFSDGQVASRQVIRR